MSEHNHTGLDEAASVASNTMQAVRTGKAISAAAKGAAAGGPYPDPRRSTGVGAFR